MSRTTLWIIIFILIALLVAAGAYVFGFQSGQQTERNKLQAVTPTPAALPITPTPTSQTPSPSPTVTQSVPTSTIPPTISVTTPTTRPTP